MFNLGICISIYTKKYSFLILSYQVYITYLVDCEIGNGPQLNCFFLYVMPSLYCRVRSLWLIALCLILNFLVCFLWQLSFWLIIFQSFVFASLRQCLACSRYLNTYLFKKDVSTYYESGIFFGLWGSKTFCCKLMSIHCFHREVITL